MTDDRKAQDKRAREFLASLTPFCPFCSGSGLRSRTRYETSTGRYVHDVVSCHCTRKLR